eukprot:gene24009-29056_t
MADWFTSFASQALKLADDLADSLVSQANEAQQTIQNEQRKLKEAEETRRAIHSTHTLLPWDTLVESRQILSKALMEQILALSLNEKHFTTSPQNSDEVEFSMADFAPTAMRLLELDGNLKRVHAKLSPRMDEEEFWRHYYCRIIYLRCLSGIEGLEAQKRVEAMYKKEDIIFPIVESIAPAPTPAPTPAAKKSSPSHTHTPSSSTLSLTRSNIDKVGGDNAKGGKGPSPTPSPSAPPASSHPSSSPLLVTMADLEGVAVSDEDIEGLEGFDDLGDLEGLEGLDEVGEGAEGDGGAGDIDDDELEAQIARELGEM